MRNIFDQYSQPENRLTHSLVMALHYDRRLLESFLLSFGPEDLPDAKKLKVIEQGLPGSVMFDDEEEAERRGLPDAVISSENGWALVIESKISAILTNDQLQRHSRTLQKCGLDDIHGLSITVAHPPIALEGWRMATWKDVYAWANKNAPRSEWAKRMVDYFNVAEEKMAQKKYLTEGTITEFSGIDIDPYTYLEGKRVLRLLTDKIKGDESFVKEMDLDKSSGRPAITNDFVGVWDYISFNIKTNLSQNIRFNRCPHCTFGISDKEQRASAMMTFPNAIERIFAKKLIGPSYADFSGRLHDALLSLKKNLGGVRGYKPVVRVSQSHFKGQKKEIVDGLMTVDLRACFGDTDPDTGRPFRKQEQWLQGIHGLLSNKRANIEFQIGVHFPFGACPSLKEREADKLFMSSLRALRPFVKKVQE